MSATPSRRTVVRTATWSAPAVAVVAAAPAYANTPTPPNLSTSTSSGSTRDGTDVTVNPTTFRNTGGTTAEGLDVRIQTGDTVNAVTVFGVPVTNFGITFTPPLPSNDFTMKIPAGTSLGQITIPPEGSYTAPAAQVFSFATSDPTTMNTTVVASNAPTTTVPFISNTTV